MSPGAIVIDDAPDRLRRLGSDGALVGQGKITDLHGITLPFGNQDRAIVQIGRDGLGIERSGHHDHGQVGALALLQMFHQREGDIAEQVPLVEFIEDHRADIGQRTVILEPAQEDAFGDKTDAGAHAGVIVEPDLITNLCPELPPALPRHPGGHGAGGDAPGLQHHDHFIARDSLIQQHLRHLRGLARARGGDQHQAIPGLQGAQNVGVDLPDGERGGGRHGMGRQCYGSVWAMPTGSSETKMTAVSAGCEGRR